MRFSVANIDVEISSAADIVLGGRYEMSRKAKGNQKLQLHLTRDENVASNRRSANYPGFTAIPQGQTLSLSRYDVRGSFDLSQLSSGVVVGTFSTGPSENSLEALIRIGCGLLLSYQKSFLLHSSVVVSNGEALVFCGVSGIGKSTISRLLDAASSAKKVSDELIVVDVSERPKIVIPPFIGEYFEDVGYSAPIKAIYLLSQGPEDVVTPLTPRNAMTRVLSNALIYAQHPQIASNLLEIGGALMKVPVYGLRFAPTENVKTVLGID